MQNMSHLIPNAGRPVAFRRPDPDTITYWSPAPGTTHDRPEWVRKTVRITQDSAMPND